MRLFLLILSAVSIAARSQPVQMDLQTDSQMPALAHSIGFTINNNGKLLFYGSQQDEKSAMFFNIVMLALNQSFVYNVPNNSAVNIIQNAMMIEHVQIVEEREQSVPTTGAHSPHTTPIERSLSQTPEDIVDIKLNAVFAEAQKNHMLMFEEIRAREIRIAAMKSAILKVTENEEVIREELSKELFSGYEMEKEELFAELNLALKKSKARGIVADAVMRMLEYKKASDILKDKMLIAEKIVQERNILAKLELANSESEARNTLMSFIINAQEEIFRYVIEMEEMSMITSTRENHANLVATIKANEARNILQQDKILAHEVAKRDNLFSEHDLQYGKLLNEYQVASLKAKSHEFINEYTILAENQMQLYMQSMQDKQFQIQRINLSAQENAARSGIKNENCELVKNFLKNHHAMIDNYYELMRLIKFVQADFDQAESDKETMLFDVKAKLNKLNLEIITKKVLLDIQEYNTRTAIMQEMKESFDELRKQSLCNILIMEESTARSVITQEMEESLATLNQKATMLFDVQARLNRLSVANGVERRLFDIGEDKERSVITQEMEESLNILNQNYYKNLCNILIMKESTARNAVIKDAWEQDAEMKKQERSMKALTLLLQVGQMKLYREEDGEFYEISSAKRLSSQNIQSIERARNEIQVFERAHRNRLKTACEDAEYKLNIEFIEEARKIRLKQSSIAKISAFGNRDRNTPSPDRIRAVALGSENNIVKQKIWGSSVSAIGKSGAGSHLALEIACEPQKQYAKKNSNRSSRESSVASVDHTPKRSMVLNDTLTRESSVASDSFDNPHLRNWHNVPAVMTEESAARANKNIVTTESVATTQQFATPIKSVARTGDLTTPSKESAVRAKNIVATAEESDVLTTPSKNSNAKLEILSTPSKKYNQAEF